MPHVSRAPAIGAGNSSFKAAATGSTHWSGDCLLRARCSQEWQSADTTGSDEPCNAQPWASSNTRERDTRSLAGSLQASNAHCSCAGIRESPNNLSFGCYIGATCLTKDIQNKGRGSIGRRGECVQRQEHWHALEVAEHDAAEQHLTWMCGGVCSGGAGVTPAQGALHDQHIAMGELRCRSF